MAWYGWLLIGCLIGFVGGVIAQAWIDSKFPEQATTEQKINKQKVKGEGVTAIFKNIFTKKEKK